jgi:hypothetical protein
MKGQGINNTLKFILTENSPILQIRSGNVEESDKKLIKGTIVEGMLKTRVVKIGKEKLPYRFIELKNKKGYLSPSALNVYIDNFANLDGEEKVDLDIDVKETAFGEKTPPQSKTKTFIINWALPITGGFIGYKIAKKMDADNRKTFGYVVFFALLGMIPRFMYKK